MYYFRVTFIYRNKFSYKIGSNLVFFFETKFGCNLRLQLPVKKLT